MDCYIYSEILQKQIEEWEKFSPGSAFAVKVIVFHRKLLYNKERIYEQTAEGMDRRPGGAG